VWHWFHQTAYSNVCGPATAALIWLPILQLRFCSRGARACAMNPHDLRQYASRCVKSRSSESSFPRSDRSSIRYRTSFSRPSNGLKFRPHMCSHVPHLAPHLNVYDAYKFFNRLVAAAFAILPIHTRPAPVERRTCPHFAV
jgi:hypothetical protein